MALADLKIYNELAERALSQYDLPAESRVKLLHVSENITYLVHQDALNFKAILRINRPGYHTRTELEAEIVWMKEIMRSTPLIVPTPIKTKDNQYILELVTSHPDIAPSVTCAMYDFLTGVAPDEEDESRIRQDFERLGETTAYLHRQVRSWDQARTLNRFTWDFESMVGENGRWGRWQAAPDMTPELAQLFQRALQVVQKRLRLYGQSPERFGLIHADLRLANLLVEGDQIKVIDFDDCGYGWFMHDLAAAVSFIEHKSITPELVEAWIQGYRKIQKITLEDYWEIDTFILQRRLQLMAWLASHYDSDPVKELSKGFTAGSATLAEQYLRKFT